MSENNIEFLHGLEEYCDYKNHRDNKKLVKKVLDILYSDDPRRAFSDQFLYDYIVKDEMVKTKLVNNIKNFLYADDTREIFVNTFLPRDLAVVYGSEEFEKDLILWLLKNCESDDARYFRYINDFIRKDKDIKILSDAMSRSQVRSKVWLVNELKQIKRAYKNVALLAGWYGQLVDLFGADDNINFRKFRNVELDREACLESDYNFNLRRLEEHKVKAVNADINNLTLHSTGYEWEVENFKSGEKYTEKFLPELIINTISEHMTTEWSDKIRFKPWEEKPIVAIQNNNYFDLDEHINCVHSIDHMKKIFPMSEILYEGELQLKGYKRVMLIGKP